MKFGFIFPGYGNQWVGMGKEFYDMSRSMQEYFEEAANCLDKNLVKLCFASSEADLAQLENAYISLYLISFSIARILKEQGIEPSVVAGYDIGEYAAVSSVDGITLPDALYLLRKYSGLYQELLNVRQFAAVRVTECDVTGLKEMCTFCANGSNISFVASQEHDDIAILAGTSESVTCITDELKKGKTGKITSAPVGGGLHSPLMDDVLKTMKMYLEKVDFKDVSIPFVTSVTGQALKEGDKVRAAVMQQIHAPLQWKKVIDAFEFCDCIVIPGPGATLIELLKSVFPDKKIVAITNVVELNDLLVYAEKPVIKKEHEDDSAHQI